MCRICPPENHEDQEALDAMKTQQLVHYIRTRAAEQIIQEHQLKKLLNEKMCDDVLALANGEKDICYLVSYMMHIETITRRFGEEKEMIVIPLIEKYNKFFKEGGCNKHSDDNPCDKVK